MFFQFSGTIQREIPSSNSANRNSFIYYEEDDIEKSKVSEFSTNSCINSLDKNCKTFFLNSLGWLLVKDSELIPTLSSITIQKCVSELLNKKNMSASCWNKQDTKRLILKIEYGCLRFLDAASSKLLYVQPISNIKAWDVISNEFAYAVKENNLLHERDELGSTSHTSQIKCYVFHCEVEKDKNMAQKIAKCIKNEEIRFKSQTQIDYSEKNKIEKEKKSEDFDDDYDCNHDD